jgi:hypothetical protein
LSRADLLAGVEGVWGLIRDHDRRCDCDRVRGLLAPGPADAERELAEIVRYDDELRRLMVARGGLEADMLDFLLGRPMPVVVRLMRREGGAAEPAAAAPAAAPRDRSA